MPLISIITPVYNAENFLEQTLLSIAAQTHKNFEVILILDKKTTDKSEEIISFWTKNDNRFSLFRDLPEGGVSFNRNYGLDVAKGEFICFLDSDDIWVFNKLELQIRFMKEQNCQASCTAFQKMSELGYLSTTIVIPKKVTYYRDILKNNRIGCLTVMLTSDLAKRVKFKNIMHEDFDYWLQTLHLTEKIYGMPQILAFYRVVKGSRSSNKIYAARARWNILRNVEQLSLLKSIYYFSFYALTAIKKY